MRAGWDSDRGAVSQPAGRPGESGLAKAAMPALVARARTAAGRIDPETA
jgi:hypothetical protein